MLSMTDIEVRFLLDGKADGITRSYGVGQRDPCPYSPGDGVILTTPMGNAFAKAKIRSIRPGTVKQRMTDDTLAQKDGFTNAMSWGVHWRRRYGPGDAQCFRIQLHVEAVLDG